jgi:hypothetical protein
MNALDRSKSVAPQDLLRRATKALQALAHEHGFTSPHIDGYAPESFGNCLIVFESPEFQIHVVRDRGQIFIDVGLPSESARWPLGHLVGFLEGEAAPRAIEGLELNCEVLNAYASRVFDRELLRDRGGQLAEWAQAWASRTFAPRSS